MQKLLSITLIIILFLFGTCEPKYSEPFELYKITSGTHGHSLRGQTLQSNNLKFKAVFDESAVYESKLKENQHDVNKLMGFSDCNSHHHNNSARFGWRWLNDQLEIMAYCYVSGERIVESVGVVEFDKAYEYNLSIFDDKYSFQLEGFPTVHVHRKPKCERGFYYLMYPYFGGDEVAPHDITIKIQIEY